MRKKKDEEPAPPARADGRITPLDVQQVEFRLAFRGYNERDVDAFLDRVTGDLSWYLEENQRLGAVPASAIASVPVAGDAAAARTEAERILAGAREEAQEIVRRAERDAAAIRAAGAAPGDPRAAVAPFLNREREFLQSLGALVQGHAEEVKAMVLALRARAEAAAAAPAATPVTEPVEPVADVASVEAASAAEIRERLGEPEPPPAPPSEEPDRVTIEEPAYSTEGAQAGEGRDRSLRELFWGDD
jgi:DivIVA domain-containing protein